MVIYLSVTFREVVIFFLYLYFFKEHYYWTRNIVPNLFQNVSSIGIKQLFTSVHLCRLKISTLIGSFSFRLYVAATYVVLVFLKLHIYLSGKKN